MLEVEDCGADISCGYVRRADTEPGICTKQFLEFLEDKFAEMH